MSSRSRTWVPTVKDMITQRPVFVTGFGMYNGHYHVHGTLTMMVFECRYFLCCLNMVSQRVLNPQTLWANVMNIICNAWPDLMQIRYLRDITQCFQNLKTCQTYGDKERKNVRIHVWLTTSTVSCDSAMQWWTFEFQPFCFRTNYTKFFHLEMLAFLTNQS